MDWLSAGASLLGGWLGKEGQEDTNVANAQQAQAQMDFQERMSNTSYQRAVTDLKAAGLNPMLAYARGGASTPGGAMAQMGNAMESAVSTASRAATVAPQAELLRKQVENTAADTKVKESQALVNAASVPHLEAQARQQSHSGSQLEQLARRLREENDLLWSRYSTSKLAGEGDLLGTQFQRGRRSLDAGEPEAHARELWERGKMHSYEALLKELQVPRARNLANAQEDWWMKGVSPYLDDVNKITHSGADLSRFIPWSRLMPFRFR